MPKLPPRKKKRAYKVRFVGKRKAPVSKAPVSGTKTIPRRSKPLPTPTAGNIGEASFRDFAEGFVRSERGNLWRRWNGISCTVFERATDDTDIGWYWVHSSEDEPSQFSPKCYGTQADAVWGLARALGVLS